MLAKKGMLEQELPRGHLHLFDGQKRHIPLRSQQLKIKEGKYVCKGCTRKKTQVKVLNNGHAKASEAQGESVE
jgi:hypothetical protein